MGPRALLDRWPLALCAVEVRVEPVLIRRMTTPSSHVQDRMRWIDRLPLLWLALVALYLAVAPFVPEPHLTEKWRMLLQGTLSRPIDIFDLFLHTTPLVVLAVRLWRDAQRRRQA